MENRYQASGRVEDLKARAKRCCCQYCGGELVIRRILFSDDEEARIELFCSQCDRIEYGVEPEIYANAVYFVDHFKFDHYPDLEDNVQTRRMNIAKICQIMTWSAQRLGILAQNGFQVPIPCQTAIEDDACVLTQSMLVHMEAAHHE